VFLLVPAYPGSPGTKAVKRLLLLLLSHRQATVERGFGINKQVETDNLSVESVVAKRTIGDYVSYVGGIEHIDVTNKKLIPAATAARQKYSPSLKETNNSD